MASTPSALPHSQAWKPLNMLLYLSSKKDMEDLIELMILKWGDFPRLSIPGGSGEFIRVIISEVGRVSQREI